MRRMVGITVVPLSLLWVLSAQAQDASVSPEAEVRKLLASLKLKAGKIKDVTFGFHKTTVAMGQQIVQDGEVNRRLPDRVRMQSSTTMPMGSVGQKAISDGRVLWQVTDSQMGTQIVKFDLVKLPGGARQAAALAMGGLMDPCEVGDPDGLLKRYDIQILPGEEANRRGVEFRPKAGAMGKMGKLRKWFGVEDGFIYKAEVYTATGDLMMSQEVTDATFNAGLPDSLFSYTPPQGATIQDGNELLNRGMEQMKKQMEQMKQNPGLTK